jgi:hypothetical protein
MKDTGVTKGFVVSVILLFIGVTIAPSINFNVVKASNDTDLVEVTTQACGINGYGNTTVKLTRQQYQNLEEYLVEFRARLNQTTSREEAVPLFKDAVVELDKYGLLPKGMSVEQAQKFVFGVNQNERICDFLSQFHNRRYILANDIQNIFCLIACHVANFSYIFNLVQAFTYGLTLFALLFVPIPSLYFWLILAIVELLLPYGFYKPFSLISIINDFSSEVSFFTLGLLGIKSDTTYLKGIYGFTGLHITLNFETGEAYYLGSALLVK